MTKQELRKKYLEKRLTLKDAQYEQLSQLLCESFFQTVDLSSINVLHSFLPIRKNREPDTWLVIKKLQKGFPDIKICIPKINSEGLMESYFLEETRIQLNSWGIPEPAGGNLVDSIEIDLIIVPLLAFDKSGYRVGYGKGYYDRFLKDCREDSKKIGLSFFPPEEKIADLFHEDFPIDAVITPDKLYSFTK
jgi:5-formyltetrahydrofolate cyclo-ligase